MVDGGWDIRQGWGGEGGLTRLGRASSCVWMDGWMDGWMERNEQIGLA
jgi:hypothetical protein